MRDARSCSAARSLQLTRAAIAAALLAGCGDNEDENPLHNDPPTTEIVSPILSGEAVSYQLEVSWRGDDSDGALSGFEFAIDDTTEWTFTSAFDTLFAFESPACCVPDTIVMPDSTVVIDSLAFGMHTLFVRAIDNRGAADPTPARISFNSTTITPEATIRRGPSPSGAVQMAPRTVVFEWEGSDADGSIAGYRYRLDDYPWAIVGSDCTRVRFVGLPVAGYAGDPNGVHEFTVLAIDNAGATERTADAPDNFRRWIASADVSWGRLCITSNVFGTRCEPLEIAESVLFGTPLSFDWIGDASEYGGEVVCYAYAYDSSIFSPCDVDLTHFPPGSPGFLPLRGSHVFTVIARDDLGESFELSFPFVVIELPPPPEKSQVLYMDDFSLGTGTSGNFFPPDFQEEAFWDTLLTGFSASKFDAEGQADVPETRILGGATTLIWYIDDESQLELSNAPANFRNPLGAYLRAGGNLILCGSFPTNALTPDNFFDPIIVQNPGCVHTPRSTYGRADASLHWYPAFCDTGYHLVYEFLGVEESYYDGSRDDLRRLVSEGQELPDGLGALPDLSIDVGKRGLLPDGTPIFEAQGLEWCEQYDPRQNLPSDPIPLWRFQDADGELRRTCAIYLPRTASRGHVVLLGFSPYFFDTTAMRDVFRRLLVIFGENYSDPG